MNDRILPYSTIEELWHTYEDFEDFACAIEQAVLQSPEIQAQRMDAQRFRKVINMTRAEREEVLVFPCDKDVVHAIDAAMEQKT